MTKIELIELLKDIPDNAIIVSYCDYGLATVKSIKFHKELDDVITGDYMFNSSTVNNAITMEVGNG